MTQKRYDSPEHYQRLCSLRLIHEQCVQYEERDISAAEAMQSIREALQDLDLSPTAESEATQ